MALFVYPIAKQIVSYYYPLLTGKVLPPVSSEIAKNTTIRISK